MEIDLAYFSRNNKIVVANMHKVKGMEFDNVYLLFDYPNYLKSDEIRALYVALTRAKNHLEIHTTNKLFRSVKVNEVSFSDITEHFPEPDVIELALTLQDVQLSYYNYIKGNLRNIVPGDNIELNESILFYNNKKVGKLSVKAVADLEKRKEAGYTLESLEVHNLVYWYDKEKENEVLVLLPKLKFKKIKVENQDK